MKLMRGDIKHKKANHPRNGNLTLLRVRKIKLIFRQDSWNECHHIKVTLRQ